MLVDAAGRFAALCQRPHYQRLSPRGVAGGEDAGTTHMAVLDRDPTAVEPGEIRETGVTMTVIGGRVVWGE